MDINFKFANPGQKAYYYATERNIVFSGAFNSGKSHIACFKALSLHSTFPKYRSLFSRQTYTALSKTTMQTFFNVVPSELIESHNSQLGVTLWKNRGMTFWIHLDKADHNTLRGFEINAQCVDQAEETAEGTVDVLDSRVGRWSGADVPEWLLNSQIDWPRNELTGRPEVPSYSSLLCNPDSFEHYIYRRYHPDSEERETDVKWIHENWDPKLGSYETYKKSLKKDPSWVAQFMKGEWGHSESTIHTVPKECILDPNEDLLREIKEKGNLYRVLDHGDSAPTCCLWFAVLRGNIIFYREYYVPGRPISYHRKSIAELSGEEYYSNNYADPQIFKKTAQKDGGFWSVAEEYYDKAINAPPLYFNPADNNEFATRNRINEYFTLSERNVHPITGERNAYGLYFIKKTPQYANGCSEAFRQTAAQKKVLLDTINGKAIYDDDRDENITDHAYDCVRYGVAMHGFGKTPSYLKPPARSFARFKTILALKKLRAPQVAR